MIVTLEYVTLERSKCSETIVFVTSAQRVSISFHVRDDITVTVSTAVFRCTWVSCVSTGLSEMSLNTVAVVAGSTLLTQIIYTASSTRIVGVVVCRKVNYCMIGLLLMALSLRTCFTQLAIIIHTRVDCVCVCVCVLYAVCAVCCAQALLVSPLGTVYWQRSPVYPRGQEQV